MRSNISIGGSGKLRPFGEQLAAAAGQQVFEFKARTPVLHSPHVLKTPYVAVATLVDSLTYHGEPVKPDIMSVEGPSVRHRVGENAN